MTKAVLFEGSLLLPLVRLELPDLEKFRSTSSKIPEHSTAHLIQLSAEQKFRLNGSAQAAISQWSPQFGK